MLQFKIANNYRGASNDRITTHSHVIVTAPDYGLWLQPRVNVNGARCLVKRLTISMGIVCAGPCDCIKYTVASIITLLLNQVVQGGCEPLQHMSGRGRGNLGI